jgi:hypothetical protein
MAAIDIQVGCHAGIVDLVDVSARTPNPAPLLIGLAPAAVGTMLGRLYAICGAAQRACAELALAAATGHALASERHGRLAIAVVDEAIQEHLWRLWIDWPALLRTSPRTAEFTHWYGAIRGGARDWPAALASALERDWLGLAIADLGRFEHLGAFDGWLGAGRAPAAQLFAALRTEPATLARATPRPASTLETPLAATPAHAWVAALEDAGRTLEAMLAARVVALVALLLALVTDSPALLDLAAVSPVGGRGIGSVGTARGWLEHDVTVVAGHVAAYAIRTPTERHFAAGGPFVTCLRGCAVRDLPAARRAASLWALAFDPCVSYAIEGIGDA